MYLITIVLPLLASIASGFFGRRIGVNGSQLVTNFAIMLTTLFSIVVFFEVGFNNTPIYLKLFKWIDSETLKVYWSFSFDSLTASMLIPVLVVSFLVHMYSIGYMSHDPHNQRFFSYLSLFTFMMIILVTADNYLLMFVGWEGVGICSYLLVSFWFTRIAANQSSMSAFLTNRVGDCFLTIGIFIMIWAFGNVDYTTVFSLSPYISESIITMVGVCLLIGAMAKSSQIGLHVWLPQAMEGPTPVSALIHAATMVTAGVYLLMRSSPLIEYSSTVLMLCLWIGTFTTVFSSLIGLFQQDIKKVIAYSTMSQLGLMVIAVGLSCYNIALFHLVNHAFYKALLFLGAGSVIHAMSDNQDFRKYGSLRSHLPLTYSAMFIASLSLVAFPFMTGFYSKDFILESAYSLFGYTGVTIYIISTTGAVFTTLYSFKVLYLTFLTTPNATKVDYNQAKENDTMMSTPLIILSIFSIFFGFISKDLFVGIGSDFYADNALYVHPNHEITMNTEFALPISIKLLPFFFTLIFIIFSLYISEFSPISLIKFKYTELGYNIFSFFNQRFYIELFYNKYITDNVLHLGSQTTKILDKGTVEMAGPYGLQLFFQYVSKIISKLDTSVVTTYALYILIGLVSYFLICYVNIQYNALIIIICLILLSFHNTLYVFKQNESSNWGTIFLMPMLCNIGGRLAQWITPMLVLICMLTIHIMLIQHNYITDIIVYCADNNPNPNTGAGNPNNNHPNNNDHQDQRMSIQGVVDPLGAKPLDLARNEPRQDAQGNTLDWYTKREGVDETRITRNERNGFLRAWKLARQLKGTTDPDQARKLNNKILSNISRSRLPNHVTDECDRNLDRYRTDHMDKFKKQD